MGVRHCEEEDTNPPRNGIHSYPSYFYPTHLRHQLLPSEASLHKEANRFEVFLSVRTKNKNRRREDEKVVIWNLRDFLFLVGCIAPAVRFKVVSELPTLKLQYLSCILHFWSHQMSDDTERRGR